MDAKSRAQFINTVGSGQGIVCPSCNSMNDPDASFCLICGTPLKQTENFREDYQEQQTAPAGEYCPSCGTFNEAGSLFCEGCGARLVAESNSEPYEERAFEPVNETSFELVLEPEPMAFNFVVDEVEEDNTTPVGVFAEGIPDWDLVPPMIAVRRRMM